MVDREDLGFPARDTSMTRREALKRGAAAGVGVGLVGCANDPVLADPSPPAQTCAPPACTPSGAVTWSIEASILNIIWGDFWPRFVACWWKNGSGAPLFDFGEVTASKLKDAMYELAKRDCAARDKATPAPPGPNAWRDTRFLRRLQMVVDYLDRKDSKLIPINFIGEGAFDFVLSDAGLDLFTPKPPDADWEWYRYYSFRHTGRPCLGVPIYMERAPLTFTLDAPTGAGQILTTPTAFENMVVANGCRLNRVSCLAPQRLPGLVSVPSMPDTVTVGGSLVTIPQVVPKFPAWKKTDHVGFRYGAFLSAVGALRCWQLEGSVYRAILAELPRVVAEIWLERSRTCESTIQRVRSYLINTGVVLPDDAPILPLPDEPNTYRLRFMPGKPQAREIFMERLETSLPDEQHMVFQADRTVEDVTITNRGFLFPEVPDHPKEDKILDEIIAGRAGNPVFTDSRRPDGDE